MSIHRVQSGLIFDDRFDTLDSRWVVSPSDSYYINEEEKTLSLSHNPTDSSTNALFLLPQDEEELLLQVQANYTPTRLGDEGGIVIWKNALEKVEFLESEDSTNNSDYSLWRAVKKQNLWTFFAKRNFAWELFDSTICINPVMAGIVLKGVDRDGYVPIDVERVILCRGSSISVGNVNSHYKIRLLSEDGKVVSEQIVPAGYSGIDVELPSIPFKGKLELYDRHDDGSYVLIDEQKEMTDMYGGDLFMRGTDLTVVWNGKELSEVTPTHLGALKQDGISQKMTVVNATTGNVAENIGIKIAMYNEEFGWEWCSLANDYEGVPATFTDKSIKIGTLHPGESKDFWVRVVKMDANDLDNRKLFMRPTHFYLDLTND